MTSTQIDKEPLYWSIQLDDGQTSETHDEEAARRKFADWVSKYPKRKVSLCRIWLDVIEERGPYSE
jgi:hypothetical protein